MKKTNKISAAVSAAVMTALMISPSVSADGVEYKVSDDLSEIIMTDIPLNHDYHREYRIYPSGHGKLFEETECFHVTAKVENVSELPENIIVKNCKEAGFPDTEGFCIYTADSVVKISEIPKLDTVYRLDRDAAAALAAKLTKIDGISDIQIYQSKNISDFTLSGNTYQIADVSYSYKYNESDFSALINKGYTVSEIDMSQPDIPDYFELTIIPPEYNEKSDNVSIQYQTLLDISELDLPKGVNVMPIIACNGSGSGTVKEKYSIIGDVDHNFIVNIYDAIGTAGYIIGKVNFTKEEKEAADINKDEKIDLYDTIEIAKIII